MRKVFSFWQEPTSTPTQSSIPICISDVVGNRAYPMLDYSIESRKHPKALGISSDKTTWGKINAVIHFAALKAVGESITKPLDYYENNVSGLIGLLKVMSTYKVNALIFSSSAVVYGRGHEAAITEDTVQVAGQGTGGGLLTNPYGRSKWMSEEIINDYCIANPEFNAISLRYFNPTGSHPSGLIGEDPKGVPNNIVPVILQAYQRRRSKVQVFGSSYDTADGTGVRDYIHVTDLASGHLAALRKATSPKLDVDESTSVQDTVASSPNYSVYNLGTGRGYSVLEIIKAFSDAAGVEIPHAIGEARPGDLGTVTASAQKAATELEWQAEFDIQDMCRDVFNWAAANPKGYETLRRLSTLQASNPRDIRKASVSCGIFANEGDFDQFVFDGLSGALENEPQSQRRQSRIGSLIHDLRAASISSPVPFNGFSGGGSGGFFTSRKASVAPKFNMQWGSSLNGNALLESAEEDLYLDESPNETRKV